MLVTFGETALRLSPPAGSRLETASELDVHTTGPESNAAVAARRFGAETAWCSALPDSPVGRRVESELRSYDVAVRAGYREGRQGLSFHESGNPPRVDRTVDDRAGTAVADVDGDDLPLDLVQSAEMSYVTGATPALSASAATATASFLKAAREGGTTAAFGLRDAPDRWPVEEARETQTGLFPAVDVLVADEGDVERVLGRDGKPTEVAHALASAHDFETVALVCEGSTLAWHDATFFEYPVLDAGDVEDACARDAFAGVFLACLHSGRNPDEALRYATAALSLARSVPGPVPAVTRAELDRVAETVADAADR